MFTKELFNSTGEPQFTCGPSSLLPLLLKSLLGSHSLKPTTPCKACKIKCWLFSCLFVSSIHFYNNICQSTPSRETCMKLEKDHQEHFPGMPFCLLKCLLNLFLTCYVLFLVSSVSTTQSVLLIMPIIQVNFQKDLDCSSSIAWHSTPGWAQLPLWLLRHLRIHKLEVT